MSLRSHFGIVATRGNKVVIFFILVLVIVLFSALITWLLVEGCSNRWSVNNRSSRSEEYIRVGYILATRFV